MWLPINEAPRDGTVVLAKTATAVYLACWRKWSNEFYRKETEAWWVVSSKPYFTPLQITITPLKWQRIED